MQNITKIVLLIFHLYIKFFIILKPFKDIYAIVYICLNMKIYWII